MGFVGRSWLGTLHRSVTIMRSLSRRRRQRWGVGRPAGIPVHDRLVGGQEGG